MSDRVEQFYRVVDHADAMKVKRVERERAVRLYCTASYGGGQWSIQVRAPIMLADRTEGRDFIVATASLDAEDMRALRDSIDAHLADLP